MLLNAKSCVDAIYCCQFNQLSLTLALKPTNSLTNKTQSLLLKSKTQYEQLQQRYQQAALSLSDYEERLIKLSQFLLTLRDQLDAQ